MCCLLKDEELRSFPLNIHATAETNATNDLQDKHIILRLVNLELWRRLRHKTGTDHKAHELYSTRPGQMSLLHNSQLSVPCHKDFGIGRKSNPIDMSALAGVGRNSKLKLVTSATTTPDTMRNAEDSWLAPGASDAPASKFNSSHFASRARLFAFCSPEELLKYEVIFRGLKALFKVSFLGRTTQQMERWRMIC
jgi:hypothetical protein